jgi:hypothetical protein
MATSLGLNPEDLFTSYSSSYYSSPPFMSDYAASFTPAGGDSTAFSSELDNLHHFDYSPAPIVTAAGAGAGGGDRNEKMMYVYMQRTQQNIITVSVCVLVIVGWCRRPC